jgi:hypothetical protein
MLPLPLHFLAAWLAVWLGRVLQQEVDYLTAENRLLREKLGGRKLWLATETRQSSAQGSRNAGSATSSAFLVFRRFGDRVSLQRYRTLPQSGDLRHVRRQSNPQFL